MGRTEAVSTASFAGAQGCLWKVKKEKDCWACAVFLSSKWGTWQEQSYRAENWRAMPAIKRAAFSALLTLRANTISMEQLLEQKTGKCSLFSLGKKTGSCGQLALKKCFLDGKASAALSRAGLHSVTSPCWWRPPSSHPKGVSSSSSQTLHSALLTDGLSSPARLWIHTDSNRAQRDK